MQQKTYFRQLSIYFADAGTIDTVRVQTCTEIMDDAGKVLMSQDNDLQAVPGTDPQVTAAIGQALPAALAQAQALQTALDTAQATIASLRDQLAGQDDAGHA